MVFENAMLPGAFGPKREAVKGGRRKLYNVQFRSMFSLSKFIKSNKVKSSVKMLKNRALF
jgi:hypothetical protein